MSYNAGDRKDVRRAKAEEKLIRRGELQDLETILASTEGQRFIWRLLERCRIYQSHVSERLEGFRDLGLWLIAEMNEIDREAYLRLQASALGWSRDTRPTEEEQENG